MSCHPGQLVVVCNFQFKSSTVVDGQECANGWAQCEHTPNVGRPFVGRLQCAGSECHVSSFNCSSWLQDLSWRVVLNVDCMCEMFLT